MHQVFKMLTFNIGVIKYILTFVILHAIVAKLIINTPAPLLTQLAHNMHLDLGGLPVVALYFGQKNSRSYLHWRDL